MEKRCAACARSFPATAAYFPRNRNAKTGLHCYCKACHSEKYKEFYARHRERMIRRAVDQVATRRKLNPDYDRVLSREAKRRKLSDKVEYAAHLRRGREWRKSNPDRVKLFKHEDPARKAGRTARRTATKLLATPPWADWAEIGAIYAKANAMTKATGVEHQVDHIVPLRGRDVCGLHVHQNLRVIPKAENLRKSNRFIPELIGA